MIEEAGTFDLDEDSQIVVRSTNTSLRMTEDDQAQTTGSTTPPMPVRNTHVGRLRLSNKPERLIGDGTA